ncbi:MAG TPA: carboxypeptidase regulatory-like domain-containing protein [bacterium]|nr:carboxypeptidase regulatory-like domain-containing protein [bacterium]
MRNIFIISIVLLSFFQFMHSEESTGEVVLYVFSLGKPAKDLRAIFDEKTVEFTDESGAARAVLNAGSHKVKVTGDKKVVAVAEFLVVSGESTRIIISAKNDGTNSEIEIEHPEGSIEKVDENINKNLAPGVFSGVVTSLVDKSVVPQASIFIKGIRSRIVTDESGSFKTELPPGSYAVSFIHAQFSTQTIEGVEIKENLETVKNIELTPASIELDEYVVLVPHIQGGDCIINGGKKGIKCSKRCYRGRADVKIG